MILVHCNQMLSLAILGIGSLTKNPKYPRQVGQSLSAPKSPHHPFRNTCYLEDHRTEFIWHITMATSPPSTVLGLVALRWRLWGRGLWPQLGRVRYHLNHVPTCAWACCRGCDPRDLLLKIEAPNLHVSKEEQSDYEQAPLPRFLM